MRRIHKECWAAPLRLNTKVEKKKKRRERWLCTIVCLSIYVCVCVLWCLTANWTRGIRQTKKKKRERMSLCFFFQIQFWILLFRPSARISWVNVLYSNSVCGTIQWIGLNKWWVALARSWFKKKKKRKMWIRGFSSCNSENAEVKGAGTSFLHEKHHNFRSWSNSQGAQPTLEISGRCARPFRDALEGHPLFVKLIIVITK